VRLDNWSVTFNYRSNRVLCKFNQSELLHSYLNQGDAAFTAESFTRQWVVSRWSNIRLSAPQIQTFVNYKSIVHISALRRRNNRAIAQAVSRWVPTAVAQVGAQVRSCGICGAHSGTTACFLRGLGFPLSILIPPNLPHSSSSIIRGKYNRPVSGQRTKWTQSRPTPRN
jgi:hypothetical protein